MKLQIHSFRLAAMFGILAFVSQIEALVFFFFVFFSTGTYLMHQISKSYLYIHSPLVIYSGLGLFLEDAQRNVPQSLSYFVSLSSIWNNWA